MKVKLIRKASTRNPEWSSAEAARSRLAGKPYRVPHSIDLEAGTVIDHPDAWQLVGLGYATPEDEEAREAAGLSDQEIDSAIKAQTEVLQSFEKKVKKARKKEAESTDQTV